MSPNKVRTSLTVIEWPKPSKTQPSDDAQRAMLRRARVPAAMSDTELRAFRRSSPWPAIKFALQFLGFLILFYFDVYGFMELCNRMGWFGGAR